MRNLDLTTENLATLAGLNGHRGVAALARRLGRNRVSLYRALKAPRRFGPTYRALNQVLRNRSMPTHE